jgi:hypothetical protein
LPRKSQHLNTVEFLTLESTSKRVFIYHNQKRKRKEKKNKTKNKTRCRTDPNLNPTSQHLTLIYHDTQSTINRSKQQITISSTSRHIHNTSSITKEWKSYRATSFWWYNSAIFPTHYILNIKVLLLMNNLQL